MERQRIGSLEEMAKGSWIRGDRFKGLEPFFCPPRTCPTTAFIHSDIYDKKAVSYVL